VTSSKNEKMGISRSIVHAVRSLHPPGRFLERDLRNNLWYEIGDRKAFEKASQALRDGAAILRRQLSADLGDPDILSAVFDMDEEGPPELEEPNATTVNKAKISAVKVSDVDSPFRT
jgi:hypothetical protein